MIFGGVSLGALILIGLVLKIKTDRELEIELNGTALMRSLQCIEDLDINLGSIEGTITWVLLPGFSKFVECLSEGSLSLIPHGIVSELVSGSCGEIKFELETENAIHVIQEVEYTEHLSHNLAWHAENVCIILLEPADTGQPGEGTGDLISVEHTEISKPKGQLSVRPDSAVKHQAVPGTVHGLHTEALRLNLE